MPDEPPNLDGVSFFEYMSYWTEANPDHYPVEYYGGEPEREPYSAWPLPRVRMVCRPLLTHCRARLGWPLPVPWFAMSLHHLKTTAPHFEALWDGSKTFELRWNDRDFQLADCLVMEEWTDGEPTGRAVSAMVSHMLHGGEYGLAEGWVCLSLKYMDRHDNQPTTTAPPPPSQRK